MEVTPPGGISEEKTASSRVIMECTWVMVAEDDGDEGDGEVMVEGVVWNGLIPC